MNLRNQLNRVLCGAGLAMVLTALPVTWALAPNGVGTPAVAVLAATQAAPLDINTATTDQLKALPGIGDVYAKKIVAGRPYSNKSQLVSKGILPQNVYSKVQTMIVASHAKK